MAARNRRSKASRAEEVTQLADIPNIGPALAADLRLLGINDPRRLASLDPYALYQQLNRKTGLRHDPCVCDAFIAAVRFMQGEPAHPWWFYTAARKRFFALHSI